MLTIEVRLAIDDTGVSCMRSAYSHECKQTETSKEGENDDGFAGFSIGGVKSFSTEEMRTTISVQIKTLIQK
jgi:hypothetical protein